jgi:hypothetical protein
MPGMIAASAQGLQYGAPELTTMKIHSFGCTCPTCRPHHPSVASGLTAGDVGKLGLTGLALGVCTGLALDPAHSARALLAIIELGL